jgi:hypothetical protein
LQARPLLTADLPLRKIQVASWRGVFVSAVVNSRLPLWKHHHYSGGTLFPAHGIKGAQGRFKNHIDLIEQERPVLG